MRKKEHFRFFVEFIEYENHFPKEFVTDLINRGICRTKKKKIKFIVTGVVIYKSEYIVIFPKAYKIPNSKGLLKDHAQVLVEVLIKYKRSSTLSSEEMELLGGNSGEYAENLTTAYSLIEDFKYNGFLRKETKIKSTFPVGRVDWVSTVNKKQPLFSKQAVIYNEPITIRKAIDKQNYLLKIHKYCVYKSIKNYGWLLGITNENIKNDIGEISIDVNEALIFLSRELHSTFAERDIRVIELLIDFLEGINLQDSDMIMEVIATPYFQNVWESICSIAFQNQYKILKEIIPKLLWDIESNAEVRSKRPDIMVIKDQVMYILDAKYYNVDSNLPGWPDVVKQLFYALTIWKNIKSEEFNSPNKKLESVLKKVNNTQNIFLFPSSEEEPIKYVGKVNVENNKDFDDIKAYRVNTYLAMKCYIGKEQFNYLDCLVELLQNENAPLE